MRQNLGRNGLQGLFSSDCAPVPIGLNVSQENVLKWMDGRIGLDINPELAG